MIHTVDNVALEILKPEQGNILEVKGQQKRYGS
jgi:hypothetical protein